MAEIPYEYEWFGYDVNGKMTPCEYHDLGCIGTILSRGTDGCFVSLAPYEPYKLNNGTNLPFDINGNDVWVMCAVKESLPKSIPAVNSVHEFYVTDESRLSTRKRVAV